MAKALKKGGVFVLSAILIMAMSMSSVFAMSDDSTRQANSSSTATINLEKTLTVDQAGKFPNIEDFNFTFERIEAWDNANTSTAQNGANIAKADIPMPAASATAHHTISAVSNDKVSVTAGDYTASATGDTTTAKTRSTALPITYTKAGYYVYKVNEVNDGATGVTYDSDSYYVCVYVANNQDASGNTTTGVYVHSITIWQNMQELTANLNQHNKDIGTDADNPGSNVANNRVTGNDTAGKVSTTENTDPDETTVNFDNLSQSNDVIISKNVKGSLGDRTKQFEFTVTLTGLVPGTTYDISDGKTPAGGFTLVSASTGTLDTTNKTITPNASGNATFLVKLTDDQAVKIEGLPAGATYTVNEAASDHIASYAITSDNEGTQQTTYVQVETNEMVEGTTYYLDNEGNQVYEGEWVDGGFIPTSEEPVQFVYYRTTTTTNGPVIVTETDANSAKETALATSTETVNATDGTITIAYTNTRDMATITGVPYLDYMLYGLIALMMAGAAALVVRRRRAYAEELD